MAFLVRLFYSVSSVLIGLPLLFTALFQSGVSVGYKDRPDAEISKNFLSGSEAFVQEAAADSWKVGYAKNELTPDDVDSHRYFLGGYLRFPAQEATGVIDELWVRAVVLDDNSGRGAVAFAWIDTVGLMNNDVKAIREKLSDIIGEGGLISVNVGATHNHSSIDTQGLWGNIPKTGRDEGYMNSVIEKTAAAIRTAYETRSEGQLYYGSKNAPSFFSDGRAPRSLDTNIHLLRFVPDDSAKREIYISNFGAHPVHVDYFETAISADFPYYADKSVNEKYNADFIFIQGAVGGAIHANMGESNGIIKNEDDDMSHIKQYGEKVADVLKEIADSAEPVDPILNVAHKQVDIELSAFLFKLVERAGLVNAEAYKQNGKVYLTTEIGYAEIGKDIKIIMMPGEAFPEIVYGNFLSAENSYTGTEYPCAALNTYFSDTDKVLTFGLCNDAIGYLVPDNDFSSGGEDGHSHETISVGQTGASTISKAFEELFESCK